MWAWCPAQGQPSPVSPARYQASQVVKAAAMQMGTNTADRRSAKAWRDAGEGAGSRTMMFDIQQVQPQPCSPQVAIC